MSLLSPTPRYVDQKAYDCAFAWVALEKRSADATPVYSLKGRLYLTDSGWIMLSVPNAVVRGAFAALDEPGVELPYHDGRLDAHISVIRPEELEQIGGPDKVTERGKLFSYQLGPVKSVKPESWEEMSRVWFITINSPELKQLRRSYGLTPLPNDNKFDFHITFGVQRRGVLRSNETSKAQSNGSVDGVGGSSARGSSVLPGTDRVTRGHVSSGRFFTRDELKRLGRKAAQGKVSQEEANYRPASPQEEAAGVLCGNCRHFNPDEQSCAVVKGEIGPEAAGMPVTSDLFEPKSGEAIQPITAPQAARPPGILGLAPPKPGQPLQAGKLVQPVGGPSIGNEPELPEPPEMPKTAADSPAEIRPSAIHGHGVFATEDLPAGQPLGIAAERVGADLFGRDMLHLTDLGLFFNYQNHDGEPNATLQPVEGGYALSPTRNVAAGEELLASPRYQREHIVMGLPDSAVLLNGTDPNDDRSIKAASKQAVDAAPGLPNRSQYGDLSRLRPGQILDFVEQLHDARRAGRHHDIRIGDKDLGLLSWAAPKGLPRPGERRLAIQQPVHSYDYKDFEGEIPEGYGAGQVRKAQEGQVLITGVDENGISLTLAHKRHPERFKLVRPKKPGKDWLLVNTTPTEMLPTGKVRYKKIDADRIGDILKNFQPGTSVQAKVDGASTLVKLLRNGIEMTSYRRSKETGRPISHTERFFHQRPKLDVPPEMVGTVLRGEIYGQRGDQGQVLSPSELGGILNSTIGRSLATQKERGVRLQNMLYDIARFGNEDIDPHQTPYARRREMLQQVLKRLPELEQQGFHLPEQATTAEDAQQLVERVRSGRHPLTSEGIVVHPPTGTPMKVPFTEEADVFVTGTFPGEGRRQQTVGGLTYAMQPGGETIGRVGTGFSDDILAEIARDPQEYVGRRARIRAKEKLPSGAYRAPAFRGFHEDYPLAKTAVEVEQEGKGLARRLWRKAAEHPPTVAVDLDGTLAEMYDSFDPEKIEKPRPNAKKILERFRDRGWRIIVWTVRGNRQLIKKWLDEHEIPYDYINKNPDQPPNSSGKVFADVYIDDRAVDGRQTWDRLDRHLRQRIKSSDVLPGGLADRKRPPEFSTEQLEKGTEVELEHTSDPAIAQEIAMDHLTEDPDYYDKLETIDKHAERKV